VTGVASELWDLVYTNDWRKKHAVGVMCENTKTNQKKVLYRRKDRPPFSYPWKEQSYDSASTVMATPPAPDASTVSVQRKHATAAEPPQQAEEFNMEDVLPRTLKKYAGSKWSEVLATEEGRNYAKFIATNLEGAPKTLCERALEAWKKRQAKAAS